MKNWMKKLVVSLVIMAMCTTSIQVSAADITQTSESNEQIEQNAGQEMTDETVQDTDGTDQTKMQDQEEETTDEQQKAEAEDETEAETADLSEQSADNAEENVLNYAYIESPYLETPGTQRIVMSWAKDEVTSMSLIVQKDDGTQEEWLNSKVEDQLYLFEKEFSDESQMGVYQAVALKVVTAEGENTYQFSDLGMDIRFGVNEEYDGIDELKSLDGESSDEIEASVATINEDGTLEEQDSIADALEAAKQDVLASQPATMSAENGVATQDAKSGKVVVALDPGHDKRHAGASANGLNEEILTLKIANYCKEELESYGGIEVYMTRTDADCPYPDTSSSGACIAKRADAAAAAGAKIFVSFHLNSASSDSANGAEIIIPNNNWKPEVGAEGKELAEDIQSELTALGLKNRGIYSKDATDGATYEDGSTEDYFSVQLHNKENGIPGIIIEHAFLTNSGDVNNFLNNEAGLKKLGVADAKGIEKYLESNQSYDDGWNTVNGKTYYYQNGKKLTGEQKIDGHWYYFGNDGVMRTGFVNLGSKTVYYNSDGQMQYGEQKIGDSWYYFDTVTGAMVTGFYDLPGKRVYYGSDGKMRYGEQKINGYWYYFDPVYGTMATGIYKLPEKTVYYGEDGRMRYGEQKIEGFWYYFDTITGKMATGFYKLPEKTVYYDADGKMLYGRQNIGSDQYYFDPVTGKMATNGFVNATEAKYYCRSDGKLVHGEQKINEGWYYFDTVTGAMVTGFYDLPEKRVYYGSDGRMRYGEQKINGYWYYFDPVYGTMATGFFNLPGKIVYYDTDGKMLYGDQRIENNWYYFDPVYGTMYTGWKTDTSGKKYYKEDGKLAVGEAKINNKWYYFDENGIMQTGFVELEEKTVYYAKSGEMLYGEQKIGNDYYYFDPVTGAMAKDTVINGVYYDNEGKRESTHLIEKTPSAEVSQMVQLFNDSGKEYPAEKLKEGGAATIEEFATIYYEEATTEGIDPAVAWCQSMVETGWLQFGGQVKIEQYNFAGLGATDGGASGADFSEYGEEGVRMGVRAQIQHLKAYAVEGVKESDLHNECVDPRFTYVTKGCAKYVEWLGAKENPTGNGWATGEGYGAKIIKLMDRL